MANISNLYIDQGSDYSTTVTVMSATGLPLNLAGYTAKAQMRKSFSSSLAYDFTCEILNAEHGQIRVTISAAANELIPPGRWLYDVEITQTSTGKKKRVVEGVVTVTPQITRT